MPPTVPTPQVANYFLHYTSREGAQNVASARLLLPGRSGRIYLTKDLYTFGADAANFLSITQKAVELALLVDQAVSGVQGPSLVRPYIGPDGTYRSGFGMEYWITTTTPISVRLSQVKEAWLLLNM